MSIRLRVILLTLWLPAMRASAREIFVEGPRQISEADGSRERPFSTISGALAKAAPGDTITIASGLYRETVRLPSGSDERPLTVRAAPDAHVVITGAQKITGWKPSQGSVHTARIDFAPERLLVGAREQPLSRKPDEGWWRAGEVDELTLVSPAHADDLPADFEGGQAYIWTSQGNTFFTVPVESIERESGRVTVVKKSRWMNLSPGDRYYLQNHPSLIDRPGEWAVEKVDDESERGYRVHFWPRDRSDLERVEAPREPRRVLLISQARNVRVEGLEILGGAKNGIDVSRSKEVTLARCVVHSNGMIGISVRDVEKVAVRHCVSWRNYCGLTLHTVRDAVIEENDIGYNRMDGLIVSWNTDDVAVRRNFLHHHLLWGHPDNLQVYRGVTNLRIIDNVLLAGGQSIMMEQTSSGVLRGNMIIGCGAYSVILGHGNAEGYEIHNNTIAYSGYGCLNLTARDYDVRENVFVTGHEGPVYGTRGVEEYEADRNLFFKAAGLDNRRILCSDDGWNQSLEAFHESTRQDANSKVGAPLFRSAPVSLGVLDSKRLTECTRDTWFLRKGFGPFRVGDTVEVDFDGVGRRVTSIEGPRITVSPGLVARPLKGAIVCNWGGGLDRLPALDLRLRPESPGAHLSRAGGPVGSRIDIGAFRRGDFDGDGERDLPPIPEGLAQGP